MQHRNVVNFEKGTISAEIAIDADKHISDIGTQKELQQGSDKRSILNMAKQNAPDAKHNDYLQLTAQSASDLQKNRLKTNLGLFTKPSYT